jgi:hypothetical protein
MIIGSRQRQSKIKTDRPVIELGETKIKRVKYSKMLGIIRTAGKFVVAVHRNCWRTRNFTKNRKFEKTTRVKFQGN